MSDSYAQQAEAEIWDAIAANEPAGHPERDPEPVAHDCDGCPASDPGVYYGAGRVENGVFIGFKGTCYRCGGTGVQTDRDRKRNEYYDNHVRRFSV